MRSNCYHKDNAKKVLNNIHEGHQGITKCYDRARSLWWPGLSRNIESFINRCNVCVKCINSTESLCNPLYHIVLGKKWRVIYFNNYIYLLVIDYFLRWVALALLNHGSTTNDIIPHLKSIFAKFGISEEIMSDEGSKFSSFAFQNFAKHYGFYHTLSSSRYPRSNGEAGNRVIHISPI